MRSLTLGAVLALTLAATAEAETVALVIGNEDYRNFRDVGNADRVPDIADALSGAGVEVITGRNASGDELARGLARFEQSALDSDTLIVVLAGRFVHSATETYFLPVDATVTSLSELERSDAISLDLLNGYLATRPGRAMLVLATEDAGRDRTGPFLDPGVGNLTSVPQGVTLVQGDVNDVRRFLRDVLSEPGTRLDEAEDVQVSGFAPDGLVILAEDAAAGTDTGTTSGSTSDEEARRQDIHDWRDALDQDTAEAYRAYLSGHPDGAFADQARTRLAEVAQSPEDSAESDEDDLALDRDARREIQRDLSILDYNTRGIDGIFGAGTRSAISAWQGDQGFEVTGYLTARQIDRLDEQALRRAAELEAEAERRRQQLEAEDRAYWQETGARGGEARYRAYLGRYPDGEYAQDARDALDVIEREKRRETSARDTAAWDEARQADTIRAYRQYLDEMPDGRFRDEAQDRIAVLRNAQSQENRAAQQEENALNLNPITRRVVEQRLAQAGYDPGTVDGVFDDRTRRAIRRYQASRGLPQTGYLTEAVVVRLLADSVRQIFD